MSETCPGYPIRIRFWGFDMVVARKFKEQFVRDLGWLLPSNWKRWPRSGGVMRFPGGAVNDEPPVEERPKPAQKRFYLGKDQSAATVTVARLEQLWACVERRFESTSIIQWWDRDRQTLWDVPLDRPYWDAVTMEIAEAVRTGQPVARIHVPEHLDGLMTPAGAVKWLRELQDAFPLVRLELADARLQQDGSSVLTDLARELRSSADDLLRSFNTQTIGEAVAASQEWLLATDERPSAGSKHRDLEVIRREFGVILLRELDTAKIDDIQDRIAARPNGARGKQIAARTAENVLKAWRWFLRWLHRSKDFEWQKPADYEVMPVSVRVSPAERAAKMRPDRVPTYSNAELVTLWRYATPFERSLMVLSLNCGFGAAEIGSLADGEILLSKAHPYAAKMGFESSAADNWIMRGRWKTGVYGEWKLWPMTARAIEWVRANRPQVASEFLYRQPDGKPIRTDDRKSGRNNQVANAWNRLTERVRKDIPEFRELSFGKLRKTGSQLVWHAADAETASLFLAHGNPCDDDLLVFYANRPFKRLFSTLALLEHQLQAVWDSVAEPFAVRAKGGPNITRAVIDRIQQLAREGWTHVAIAKELGVSRNTVMRWAARDQTAPSEGASTQGESATNTTE
jgi:hypothetical protein